MSIIKEKGLVKHAYIMLHIDNAHIYIIFPDHFIRLPNTKLHQIRSRIVMNLFKKYNNKHIPFIEH